MLEISRTIHLQLPWIQPNTNTSLPFRGSYSANKLKKMYFLILAFRMKNNVPYRFIGSHKNAEVNFFLGIQWVIWGRKKTVSMRFYAFLLLTRIANGPWRRRPGKMFVGLREEGDREARAPVTPWGVTERRRSGGGGWTRSTPKKWPTAPEISDYERFLREFEILAATWKYLSNRMSNLPWDLPPTPPLGCHCSGIVKWELSICISNNLTDSRTAD